MPSYAHPLALALERLASVVLQALLWPLEFGLSGEAREATKEHLLMNQEGLLEVYVRIDIEMVYLAIQGFN